MIYRLFIFIVTAALALGCGNNTEHSAEHEHSEESSTNSHAEHNHAEGEECSGDDFLLSKEQEKLAGIITSKVERRNISSVLEFPAEVTFNPNGVASVSAPISGRISEFIYDYGSTVTGGVKIAVIENPQNMGQKFEVKAPVSGTISKKSVITGQWVEPGMQICEIINASSVDGLIKLYPDEAGKIKKGQQVEFVSNGTSIKSSISFISPILDPVTKTIEARAKINNSQNKFSINSFVTARISTGSKNALTISRSALISEDEHYIVFVKHGEGFEKRVIIPGQKEKDYVEVLSGLDEGDIVVTKGAYRLKNVNYSSGGHGGCEH